MGAIHPRVKKPVGDRLAQAALNLVYGGNAPYTGPTLSGCSLTGTKQLSVRFNSTLLRGDAVFVKPYGKPSSPSAGRVSSNFRVLVDAKYWCSNTTVHCHQMTDKGCNNWVQHCADPGAPQGGKCGGLWNVARERSKLVFKLRHLHLNLGWKSM